MTTLITIYELEKLTDHRLLDLHDKLSRLLIATDLGTADRRNILATLEDIETIHQGRLNARTPVLPQP